MTSINFAELKNIVEATILTSEVPVSIKQIQSLFSAPECPDKNYIHRIILDIQRDFDQRGIELKKIADTYRFQSRPEYASWLRRLSEIRPRRYSRALMETLSIIAFRQPVTRGDIENIRGVSVSTEIMRTLLSNEWIEQAGHKEVPGRPALFRTTSNFLEYFNMESLDELPALDLLERQATQQSESIENSNDEN